MQETRALLAICFKLVSCLPYSLTLKMEATFSTETSVYFSGLQRCNTTLQIKHCSVFIPEHGCGGASTEAVYESLSQRITNCTQLLWDGGGRGDMAKYKQGSKNIHCTFDRHNRTREL
jgi:hypothetical protein